MMTIEPGKTYVDLRSKDQRVYIIVGLARYQETEKILVIYKALEDEANRCILLASSIDRFSKEFEEITRLQLSSKTPKVTQSWVDKLRVENATEGDDIPIEKLGSFHLEPVFEHGDDHKEFTYE